MAEDDDARGSKPTNDQRGDQGADASDPMPPALLDVVQRWLGVLALAALASRLIFGIGRWRLTIVLALLFFGWTFLAKSLRSFVRGLLGSDDEKSSE